MGYLGYKSQLWERISDLIHYDGFSSHDVFIYAELINETKNVLKDLGKKYF
jgi:hypothetical protein